MLFYITLSSPNPTLTFLIYPITLILTYLQLSCAILTDPILCFHIQSHLILLHPILSYLSSLHPILFYRNLAPILNAIAAAYSRHINILVVLIPFVSYFSVLYQSKMNAYMVKLVRLLLISYFPYFFRIYFTSYSQST